MGKILALDIGTTTTRAMLFDESLRVLGEYKMINEIQYPRPGWVEQDPENLWLNAIVAAGKVMRDDVDAIGITNQRETVILWDKNTGKPVYNAIVWQCKRTAQMVEELRKEGLEEEIRKRTGLTLSSYFSATKIKWILDNVPKAKDLLKKGSLLAGTVDTYIIWKLSGGTLHVTDHSNASRTLLFNIHKMDWDEELLEIFDIPLDILPIVKKSSEVYGVARIVKGVPIASSIGDQQAALVGHLGFAEGSLVATYGTGGFIKYNLGGNIKLSEGLLTTVAFTTEKTNAYMLEGSIFIAGALFQWLLENMELAQSYDELERLARTVNDTGDVFFVPAFAGLGAPYWDENARGIIVGLTRKSTKRHIIRAAMESIAYQSKDVIHLLKNAVDQEFHEINVGGGVAKNNFIMQLLADILGMMVIRPKIVETTAMGAAIMAGLATGVWRDPLELKQATEYDTFEPKMDPYTRDKLYSRWKKAVKRALNWVE